MNNQNNFIYYASDIHLEFYDHEESKENESNESKEDFQEILELFPGDPNGILVLAGDIGYPWRPIFREFIEYCSDRYNAIVYVTGNHEYYSKEHSMSAVDTIIQGISDEIINFHFLNNSEVTIRGLTFIGGTLFTYYPESKYDEVKKIMNDYNFYSPEEVSARHKGTVEYLYKEIFGREHEKFVVVSHHLPSYQGLALKYRHLSTNYLYANHLDFFLRKDQVCLWIAGHTHLPKTVGKLCIGPFGYPGELTMVLRHTILE